MSKLQYVLSELDAMERTALRRSPLHCLDGRAKLLATTVFLLTMLSVPLTRLSELLLYFIFPLITAAMGRLDYAALLRRSLVVVPFVAFIGLFNLLYDREPVLRIGQAVVTQGGIVFLSVILRGLLSVQALLLLIQSTGFYNLCRSMQRLGIPGVFTTQLLFVYRYIYVLLEESLRLTRARDARSFGRRSYPLRMWGVLVGQLLLRTFNRAERIGQAMLARGFTGGIPPGLTPGTAWQTRDTLFVAAWSAVLVAIRVIRPAETLFTRF